MARRVRMFIASTLDGYIAGANDDLSWVFHDGDYGYREFYAGIDTVIIGRRAYEIACALPAWPYAGRNTVVFTRNPEFRVATPDTVATSRAPDDVIAELRARKGGDLWLVGGGRLVRDCIAAGLVDDVIVLLHPLILGDGIPLIARGVPRTHLRLTRERRFPSGLIQLSYAVVHGDG